METSRFLPEQLPTHQEAALEPEIEYEYKILNSPELRAKYITLTDGLICKLIQNKTDVAIFLDKSARPVAWLVKELWETLAPKDPDTGEIMPIPEMKFLNIDREQWGAITGRSEDRVGGINVSRIPSERIEELQDLYAPIAGSSQLGDKSLLTGKHVTVVDEVRMSGDTLKMAEKILQRAFPDAISVDGEYWMESLARRQSQTSAIIGGEVPVWYSDETVTGRLVANRDTTKSMASPSSRQRTGRYWLSARFRQPDQSGRKLKEEIKELSKDLKTNRILYMPSTLWDSNLEPVGDKIYRINDITIDEYIGLRKASDNKRQFIEMYSDYIKDKAEIDK
jgi:hypothetical protein